VSSVRSLNNLVVPPLLKHSVKLKREFYIRPVLTVAKELLGKILIRTFDPFPDSNSFLTSHILAGKIVEVEAYDGSIDEAAHTFIGKTKRNEIMFGQGGLLYVYFTYGAHFCSNVVTGLEGEGTAILLRAIEPIFGLEQMTQNRFGRDLKNDKEKLNLTNGPGKICQAFCIDKDDYGTDLTKNKIFILDQPPVNIKDLVISKRIGISKSVHLPWRFYIKNNPWISRK
jgi:DNA-3-methyladenine glycosylase